jgi:tRNA(His) 5'-end guanylyltransferase
MKFNELEDKMRKFEFYHTQTVLQDSWFVVRLDGRGFSKLTKKYFEKPFDEKMTTLMTGVTSSLVMDFQADYGYTESDEISLLFRPSWNMYERRVEKIISLMASGATSTFVSKSGIKAQFDGRIVVIPSHASLVDYFRWRQEDANRNGLNTYAHWNLVKSGLTEGKASSELEHCNFKQKLNRMFDMKLDYFSVPSKFRYGVGFVWEHYVKEGFDPKKNEKVMTDRRRVSPVDPLVTGDDYGTFILNLITTIEAQPQKLEKAKDPA